MTTKRVHYYRPGAGAYCGQPRPHSLTTEIRQVSCRRCCSKLWREIALAHYRAFPEARGPRMKGLDRALRDLEADTRAANS